MEKDKSHTISLICGIQNRKQRTNKPKNSQTQRTVWPLPEGKGGGRRSKRVKGVKIKDMVTEGDLALGDEHTLHHTDDVVQDCTPETYIILLTTVTLIN